MKVSTYLGMYVCVYVCKYVCMCMQIMCVCMYTRVSAYICYYVSMTKKPALYTWLAHCRTRATSVA